MAKGRFLNIVPLLMYYYIRATTWRLNRADNFQAY